MFANRNKKAMKAVDICGYINESRVVAITTIIGQTISIINYTSSLCLWIESLYTVANGLSMLHKHAQTL